MSYLNNSKKLGMFESKHVERIFVRYSAWIKAFKIFFNNYRVVIESINVLIDDLGSKENNVFFLRIFHQTIRI